MNLLNVRCSLFETFSTLFRVCYMCSFCCFVLDSPVLSPKRRASYSRSSEQRSLNKEDFSSTLAYKDCVWQFTSGAWPCNSDRAAKVKRETD